MDVTYRYQQCTEQDYMLLRWLERMRNDGDLSHTLSEGVQSPTTFLNFFQTRPLFFRLDGAELSYACWMEACMGSAFLSFYVVPGVRDMRREKFYFFYDMIDLAFNNDLYPVTAIAGMIQERPQPNVTKRFIELHQRLGYSYSGKLPKFFDGHDCYFVSMTADDWDDNESALKKSWLKSRGRDRELGTWADSEEANHLAGVNGVTVG